MTEPTTTQLITRNQVIVQSEDDEGQETANLIVLRKARKAAEEKFDEMKRPFQEGLTRLKAEFALVIDPLKKAEQQTQSAILAWRAAEAKRLEEGKRAAQQAQEELRRQQRAKEEAARKANQPPPPPMPVMPPQPVVEQAKGWATDRGTSTVRKVPKYRVVNEELIPLEIKVDGEIIECWVLNEAAIGKLRRSYGDKPSPIPGIEFYYDETLGVR